MEKGVARHHCHTLLVKKPNICATANVSYAIRRDVICPNTRDTLKEEENPLNKEHEPLGGPKLEKLTVTHRSPTSWNGMASLWSKPSISWETTILRNLWQPGKAPKMGRWPWPQPLKRIFERKGWISVITFHKHSVCTCNNICLSNHYPCDSLQDGRQKICWNNCSNWQWGNNLLHQPSSSQKDEVALGKTLGQCMHEMLTEPTTQEGWFTTRSSSISESKDEQFSRTSSCWIWEDKTI